MITNITPYKGYYIHIVPDEDPVDPCSYDNLGIMICSHKRYSLGDKHDIKLNEFSNWDQIRKHLISKYRAKIVIPLYLLDHSGLTITTESFNDPWDSGQVGFIYTTAARMNAWYKRPRTRDARDERDCKGYRQLIQEVRAYDSFIRGNYVGFRINDINGTTLDSRGGYYDAIYAYEEAKSIIDSYPVSVEPPKANNTKECRWSIDNDGDTYSTDCDKAFDILDRAGPPEGFEFCMYCGRPIKFGN